MVDKDKWFEDFYQRNYQVVYKLCYTYLKNSSEAEDCTEDVFVKVYTGNYTFNDEEHEKKWLVVTTINLCKDHLKHWWHKKVTTIETYPEVSVKEKDDTLLQAILNLPTKYKNVIYLYYYMGYKSEEIATMLKKPSSTIRNQLAQARKLLKKELGEYYE